MKLMRTLFPILALLVLAVISSGGAATASTIHYWRFENSPGFLADSVGASTLTAAGSPTQTVLPLSGAGSAFDEAIPGTTRAIGVNSVDFATTASFPHGDFTVEALAHANILIGAFGQTLVAMGDTQVNSEAAWLLQF